jgi:hypothetical protein
MILLKVDECFAFDYLAILEVKMGKSNSEITINAWNDCRNYLKSQLDNFEQVYSSDEYAALIAANLKTFEAVDAARRGQGEVTAKYVDECNMERYSRKVQLQKRFFERNIIVEEKF